MSELAENQTYYYADGERVAVVPSRHFVAVRADEEQALALTNRAFGASSDPQEPVHVMRIPDHDIVVLKVDGVDEVDAQATASLRALAPGSTSGPMVYESPAEGQQESPTGLIDVGEIIVKLEQGGNLTSLLKKHHLEMVTEDYPEPGASVVRTTREQDSALSIANELAEQEGIEFSVPNFVRLSPRLHSVEESTHLPSSMEDEPGPAFTPNDPLLSSQWGIAKIRCPEAWDISRGSSAISVAIIDEGGNAHEDYVLAPGFDARFNDNDPTPKSSDGHGVACAGIVAATANNGRGIAGVAPNSRIRHIRIAYGAGGGHWSTTDAVIASGVRKAVNLGADVLSNSWGGGGASTVVTNAFKYAQTNGRGGKGTPIAAATGNDDVLGVIYPAQLSPKIPGFLAVGASNQWDQRKSKTSLDGESNWGSNYGPEVDVVAPGVKIPTTDIMGAGGYSGGNYISTFNGTSSATPHVAGLMALILAVDPTLRSWEVEDIIKMTATDLGASGRDNHFGFGRIDARAALEAASRLRADTWVTPLFLGTGRETYVRVRIRVFNPGINTVRLNNLTFRSWAPDGTVRDEFVFTGNPGPVMLARSGHDASFANLLLRANGNASSWSYRTTLNYGYTFWRPNAPILPLSAHDAPAPGTFAMDEFQGVVDEGGTTEVEDSGGTGEPSSIRTAEDTAVQPGDGDSITVDRASRAITIVVR